MEMALTLVEQYEYEENGIAYIYSKYQRSDGGYTEDRHVKSDLPQEQKTVLVTNADILNAVQARHVQRGHIEAVGTSMIIPLEPVDVSCAAVSISGPVKSYMLSEDKLAVQLTEPGYINWEVRG